MGEWIEAKGVYAIKKMGPWYKGEVGEAAPNGPDETMTYLGNNFKWPSHFPRSNGHVCPGCGRDVGWAWLGFWRCDGNNGCGVVISRRGQAFKFKEA
jgi:hypothetical protein